jgi:hypothetical protein
VPAVVRRNEPELIGEIGARLLVPRESTSGVAVTEKDRIAGLVDAKRNIAATSDGMLVHKPVSS